MQIKIKICLYKNFEEKEKLKKLKQERRGEYEV